MFLRLRPGLSRITALGEDECEDRRVAKHRGDTREDGRKTPILRNASAATTPRSAMYWMNANHAPRFSTLRRWLPSAKNWSSIRPAEPGTSCSYSRMMDGGSMGTVTWTPNT